MFKKTELMGCQLRLDEVYNLVVDQPFKNF